jgi:hypothetical protein
MLADARNFLQLDTFAEVQTPRGICNIYYKYALGLDNNLYQVFECYYDMIDYWKDNPEIDIYHFGGYENACLAACNIEK